MTVDVKELYEEISADEGKVLHAYLCSELHATIGIGHKILDTDPEKDLEIYGINWETVPEDQYITEHRCYVLFQEDVQKAISGCMNIYSTWEELPKDLQHILINMAFQLGERGLSRFKNMNSAIERREWVEAGVEMMDSRWAGQTPNRATRLQQRMIRLEFT